MINLSQIKPQSSRNLLTSVERSKKFQLIMDLGLLHVWNFLKSPIAGAGEGKDCMISDLNSKLILCIDSYCILKIFSIEIYQVSDLQTDN